MAALKESRSRVKSSILCCNSVSDTAASPVRWDCDSSIAIVPRFPAIEHHLVFEVLEMIASTSLFSQAWKMTASHVQPPELSSSLLELRGLGGAGGVVPMTHEVEADFKHARLG